ncbi:hypothetical protein CXF90_15130, partial [Stenotrophomonas sp. Betaine-02u-23]
MSWPGIEGFPTYGCNIYIQVLRPGDAFTDSPAAIATQRHFKGEWRTQRGMKVLPVPVHLPLRFRPDHPSNQDPEIRNMSVSNNTRTLLMSFGAALALSACGGGSDR